MKVTCTQENLTHALSIVSQSVGTDTTLPVLSNVLLETEGGRLKLSGTDLETGINMLIGGKVEKAGSVTVPAKLFAEYTRSLPNDKVLLEVKNNTLKISCGSFSASLNGIDPEEFPLIPQIKDKEICSVSAQVFLKGLNKTIFAAATDDSRPELAGVFVEFSPKKITLAATDSYRLAENIVEGAVIKGGAKSVIVPAKTFNQLIHILGESVDGNLTMHLSENQMMFKYGDATLVTRLVEGQYPDYKQIIPDSFQTEAVCNQKELGQSVKTTGLFSRDASNDIQFEFNVPAKEIVLTASSSQVGKNTSKFGCKMKGETSQVIFNHRYLLDGLAPLTSEEVNLFTNGSSGPGVLRGDDDKGYTYVVMPIKQ